MADDGFTVHEIAEAKRKRDAKKADPNAWQERLTSSKQGNLHATEANVSTILAHAPDSPIKVAWNLFTSEIEHESFPKWHEDDAGPRRIADEPGPWAWADEDDVRLTAWFARRWQLRASPELVRRTVVMHAKRKETHPVRNYLRSVKWDGIPRVSSWLSRYLGAPSNAYTSNVSLCFMVGAVARIERPGCKLDTMLVLEGNQGIGKSTALATLFGRDWYSDTPPDLASKDRFIGMRGKWCVEWAEIDGFDRADHARVKSFLSSPSDDFRPPYGRSNVRIDRQCIFAGTTNADGYLRDTTGNRRFFAVRCSKVDLAALEADRDQLWAEARALYLDGKDWWPSADLVKVFEAEQSERVAVDSWEDPIASYIDGRLFVTVSEILQHALGLELAKHGQAEQNRVARALQKLGRHRAQRRVQGAQTWGYVTTVTGAGK